MFKEFKEFAMRGNVVDMAVGIIIGASFGSIVNSLVADIIMPPIGMVLGRVDFSNLFVVLNAVPPRRGVAEAAPVAEARRAIAAMGAPVWRQAIGQRSAFVQAVVDPVMNHVHCTLARGHRGGMKQSRLEMLRRRCLKEGPESLSGKEISMLAKDKESLRWLHQEAWRAPHESYWGRVITARNY